MEEEMTDIITPSILSGFMELLPEDQVLFNKLKDTIKDKFELYGFWPLDTPTIEKSEILFAKGGGETTKQIYRIDKGESTQEQALRFDLTVPLARYVAQHASELNFPFRRYQIAKVFRGERSQKGRYREFYQCDIDIVGRDKLSLDNDAEIPAVIYEIFSSLGLSQVTIHVNNRRLLNGFMAHLGITNSEEVLRTIDKLAKIGEEKVREILTDIGLSVKQADDLFRFVEGRESNQAVLDHLRDVKNQVSPDSDYIRGLDELTQVYEMMQVFGIPEQAIKIDLSITRGLDYYTGTVYECFLKDYESIGSVCSGGRYDDLASNFTKEHLPGIGVSIGLTRLFYQLQAAKLVEAEKGDFIQVMVMPLGEEDKTYAIQVINKLREAGVRSQIYLEDGKVKKKFNYADHLGARYVLLVGESEREQQKVSIKDLESGEQKTFKVDEAIALLRDKA